MSRRSDRDDGPRIVYYPTGPTSVTLLTPAQAAARDRAAAAGYQAWARRQRELAEEERRFRLRALGAGAVVALVLLIVAGLGVRWLLGAFDDLATGPAPELDGSLVRPALAILGLFGGGLVTVRICTHKNRH